ncbi:MAG: accessory factor UbiK family protein [Gammaproteobacteria bacterium]|nr:accessory factor UbiK family protein [Gammaproteobacteria bacterium]
MPGNNINLDNLLDQITSALPSGWQDMKEDLDRNLHAALRSALGKLDLVTREEFEIQREVLARTRARCDALAEQLTQLEKDILKK